jgi:hypothetical protein
MNREALDPVSNSIKGDPLCLLKATAEKLILVHRLRQPPMNRLSANQRFDGTQPTNISLINRREKLPDSFYYQYYQFT